MTRCLIVSSYQTPCGIAQFVEHLVPVLEKHGEISLEVAALPVDIFRSTTSSAKRMARQRMREIIAQARAADVVNIQYEPGLFGVSPWSILRRVLAIVHAAKKVILTFHTFPNARGYKPSLNMSSNRKWLADYAIRFLHRVLLAYIRAKPSKYICFVQTGRERKRLILQGVEAGRVVDHPLAFVDRQNKERLENYPSREALLNRFNFQENDTLIGVFGFLSEYKGIDVAINAIRLLPNDHKLLIFGRTHPEVIQGYTERIGYIEALTSLIDRQKIQSSIGLRKRKLIDANMLERVIFAGAPNNEELIDYMHGCDAVVLPYIEVGQTSSGPASVALDLEKPLYLTNTHCFNELAKYAVECLTQFDIGNHVQLAQQIKYRLASRKHAVEARAAYSQRYNVENLASLYADAARKLAGTNVT